MLQRAIALCLFYCDSHITVTSKQYLFIQTRNKRLEIVEQETEHILKTLFYYKQFKNMIIKFNKTLLLMKVV